MQEQQVNIWTVRQADALCITTNGTRRKNGTGVMGRGVARQAKERYPALERTLGLALQTRGNVPSILLSGVRPILVSLPVKHHWYEPADLTLIEVSTRAVVAMANEAGWQRVVLPRPGCGNGQLSWAKVEPVIRPLLDDRFLIVWQ